MMSTDSAKTTNFDRLRKGYASIRKSFRFPQHKQTATDAARLAATQLATKLNFLNAGSSDHKRLSEHQQQQQQVINDHDETINQLSVFDHCKLKHRSEADRLLEDRFLRAKNRSARREAKSKIKQSKNDMQASREQSVDYVRACDEIDLRIVDDVRRNNLDAMIGFGRESTGKSKLSDNVCNCKVLVSPLEESHYEQILDYGGFDNCLPSVPIRKPEKSCNPDLSSPLALPGDFKTSNSNDLIEPCHSRLTANSNDRSTTLTNNLHRKQAHLQYGQDINNLKHEAQSSLRRNQSSPKNGNIYQSDKLASIEYEKEGNRDEFPERENPNDRYTSSKDTVRIISQVPDIVAQSQKSNSSYLTALIPERMNTNSNLDLNETESTEYKLPKEESEQLSGHLEYKKERNELQNINKSLEDTSLSGSYDRKKYQQAKQSLRGCSKEVERVERESPRRSNGHTENSTKIPRHNLNLKNKPQRLTTNSSMSVLENSIEPGIRLDDNYNRKEIDKINLVDVNSYQQNINQDRIKMIVDSGQETYNEDEVYEMENNNYKNALLRHRSFSQSSSIDTQTNMNSIHMENANPNISHYQDDHHYSSIYAQPQVYGTNLYDSSIENDRYSVFDSPAPRLPPPPPAMSMDAYWEIQRRYMNRMLDDQSNLRQANRTAVSQFDLSSSRQKKSLISRFRRFVFKKAQKPEEEHNETNNGAQGDEARNTLSRKFKQFGSSTISSKSINKLNNWTSRRKSMHIDRSEYSEQESTKNSFFNGFLTLGRKSGAGGDAKRLSCSWLDQAHVTTNMRGKNQNRHKNIHAREIFDRRVRVSIGSVSSLRSVDSGLSCNNQQQNNSSSSGDEQYYHLIDSTHITNTNLYAAPNDLETNSSFENPKICREVIGVALAQVDCNPCAYDKEALVFKRGDLIDILERNDSGNWIGRSQSTGQIGHFKFINITELNKDDDGKEKQPDCSLNQPDQSWTEDDVNMIGSPKNQDSPKMSYITKLEIRAQTSPISEEVTIKQKSRSDEKINQRSQSMTDLNVRLDVSKQNEHSIDHQELDSDKNTLVDPSRKESIMSSLEQLLFAIGLAGDHISKDSDDLSYLQVLQKAGISKVDSFSALQNTQELDHIGIINHQHQCRLLMAAKIIRQAGQSQKISEQDISNVKHDKGKHPEENRLSDQNPPNDNQMKSKTVESSVKGLKFKPIEDLPRIINPIYVNFAHSQSPATHGSDSVGRLRHKTQIDHHIHETDDDLDHCCDPYHNEFDDYRMIQRTQHNKVQARGRLEESDLHRGQDIRQPRRDEVIPNDQVCGQSRFETTTCSRSETRERSQNDRVDLINYKRNVDIYDRPNDQIAIRYDDYLSDDNINLSRQNYLIGIKTNEIGIKKEGRRQQNPECSLLFNRDRVVDDRQPCRSRIIARKTHQLPNHSSNIHHRPKIAMSKPLYAIPTQTGYTGHIKPLHMMDDRYGRPTMQNTTREVLINQSPANTKQMHEFESQLNLSPRKQYHDAYHHLPFNSIGRSQFNNSKSAYDLRLNLSHYFT